MFILFVGDTGLLVCVCVSVCVPGIHSKNLVAILHLLVTLARYYRAPIRLPENVVINVIVVQVRFAYSCCQGFVLYSLH